ncbi:MAG: ubiquinone-binding protein [Candidatus Pelagibacter sp.]|nr:ubiquinone-binding protein [Candidatus Pelagibacter sp.]OUV87278.1 MAG: ubiquinone-binding protein [Pelagibacteraceae bacterium TMED136]
MSKKNIIKKFDYSLELIENLILDIDSYKDFLPWCTNSKVTSKKKNNDIIEIIADLEIGYSLVKDIYTSHVKYNRKEKKIVVNAISGPLKTLENIWVLKEINDKTCEVEFSINLELKNIILDKMLNKMFDIGFKKILNSFEERAKYLENLN